MNFVGEYKIRLEAVDSTNEALKMAVKETDLPEGALLWTDKQLSGKGQLGTKWETNPGENFTGTYLLKPEISTDDTFSISMITALAVKETVEELLNSTQKSVSIKWPNDVLVNDRKIAGILIENQLQLNQITKSFLGIGLNVNQSSFSDFKRKATSLQMESSIEFNLDAVISKLSIHLQQFYMLYKTKGVQPIKLLYMAALYQNQEWANYKIEEEVSLKITDVSPNGYLVVENRKGEKLEFELKELEFLS